MTAASPSTSSITSQADRIAPAISSPGPDHQSLFPNACPYGRLRARTPSGGSGPRTAAALRTLPREQLRVRAGVGKPPPPPGATPFFDGRAYGPPLCGGTPPATPPSKTIAHPPYAFIPAVRLIQAGGSQPISCPSPRVRCRNPPPVGAPLVGARPAVCAIVIHS